MLVSMITCWALSLQKNEEKNPRKQLWQQIPEAVWAEEEQRPNFYRETFMKSKDVYSFKILISLCAVIP